MSNLQQHIQTYFETGQDTSSALASLFEVELLERNDFHTKQGSLYGKLSIIKSGFLRIYRQTEKKEVTQWISSPGDLTTDLNSIMFSQQARWNIQAITECELYTLSFSNYQKIAGLVPEWPQIEKMFLGKCFMMIEDRVFSFLSMNSEERYHFLYQTKRDLFQQVPQQYLASMLGMTPETFSRIRNKSVS